MTPSARGQSIRQSYDIVVVGAGNGGLITTAILASKGLKVLLLEQHNVPGGFATSFVRGRFEFEGSGHLIADFGTPEQKGRIRSIFEDDLGMDLDWVRIPDGHRLMIKDESIDTELPMNKQQFVEAIEKQVPGARQNLEDYLALCGEITRAIKYIETTEGNPKKSVLLTQYSNFLKTAAYTVDEVTERFNLPATAQDMINAWWVYLGVPSNRLNFTVWGAMLDLLLNVPTYMTRHRSHHFTTALDRRIREMGGTVIYNTRVEQILVEKGEVVGLKTSQGDHIKTDHVIMNTAPSTVYNELVYPHSEVPKIALQNANSRVPGVACVTVYLGLNRSAEELGLNDYSYLVFQSGNSGKMYETLDGFEPGVQACCCINAAIPDASPDGTAILSLTTIFQPQVWETVRQQDYFRLKNEVGNRLIDDFETTTKISLRPYIEEVEIATPVTFSRYTTTHRGIIYGYQMEPWDSMLPRLMSRNTERYIKGLDFVGGFGLRAHGYSSSMIGGKLVALIKMQEMAEKLGNREVA